MTNIEKIRAALEKLDKAGAWMSAALDDHENTCAECKADFGNALDAIETLRALLDTPAQAEAMEALDRVYRDLRLSRTWIDGGECNIIRAALQSARPVIRPLAWEMGSGMLSARAPFGLSYVIIFFDERATLYLPTGSGIDKRHFQKIEDAKAAAEAHWQSKIGECLTESAKPETLHKPASDKQALRKIEGLREAVAAADFALFEGPSWPVMREGDLETLLKAARAQLAAQEAGEGMMEEQDFKTFFYVSERQSKNPAFMDMVKKALPGVEVLIIPNLKTKHEE